MARPRIDDKIKVARQKAALRAASKLNPELPSRVYASVTSAGKVLVRYEPKVGRKITLHSRFPSPEFLRELADAQEGRGSPQRVVVCKPGEATYELKTWGWLCQEFFESDAFMKFAERERRVRRNLLEQTCVEQLLPDALISPRFGAMPIQEFRTQAIKTLRDRRARFAMLPDTMYPDDRTKDRQGPSTPEAGNSVVRFIRLVMGWAVEEHADLVGGRNWGRDVKLLPSGTTGCATWGQISSRPSSGRILEAAPRGSSTTLPDALVSGSRTSSALAQQWLE